MQMVSSEGGSTPSASPEGLGGASGAPEAQGAPVLELLGQQVRLYSQLQQLLQGPLASSLNPVTLPRGPPNAAALQLTAASLLRLAEARRMALAVAAARPVGPQREGATPPLRGLPIYQQQQQQQQQQLLLQQQQGQQQPVPDRNVLQAVRLLPLARRAGRSWEALGGPPEGPLNQQQQSGAPIGLQRPPAYSCLSSRLLAAASQSGGPQGAPSLGSFGGVCREGAALQRPPAAAPCVDSASVSAASVRLLHMLRRCSQLPPVEAPRAPGPVGGGAPEASQLPWHALVHAETGVEAPSFYPTHRAAAPAAAAPAAATSEPRGGSRLSAPLSSRQAATRRGTKRASADMQQSTRGPREGPGPPQGAPRGRPPHTGVPAAPPVAAAAKATQAAAAAEGTEGAEANAAATAAGAAAVARGPPDRKRRLPRPVGRPPKKKPLGGPPAGSRVEGPPAAEEDSLAGDESSTSSPLSSEGEESSGSACSEQLLVAAAAAAAAIPPRTAAELLRAPVLPLRIEGMHAVGAPQLLQGRRYLQRFECPLCSPAVWGPNVYHKNFVHYRRHHWRRRRYLGAFVCFPCRLVCTS